MVVSQKHVLEFRLSFLDNLPVCMDIEDGVDEDALFLRLNVV